MAAPGQSRPSRPSGAAGAFLALRFLLELVTIAALAVVGASLDAGLARRVVAAIGAPVVLMVVWGIWLAPRAGRRLRDPARLVAEIVIFALAAVALGLTGYTALAIVYAVVTIGAAVLSRRVASED